MAKDKLLDVEIVTPQKIVFSGQSQSVTLPGTKSPFQVLFNHAPIVSSLDLGMIKVVDENNKAHCFATSEGFVEVSSNKVSVLVESSDDVEEIDLDKVNSALKSAKEQLQKAANNDEAEKAKYQIRKNENLIKSANYGRAN